MSSSLGFTDAESGIRGASPEGEQLGSLAQATSMVLYSVLSHSPCSVTIVLLLTPCEFSFGKSALVSDCLLSPCSVTMTLLVTHFG